MLPRNKLRIAKLSLVLAVIPFVVHGYETGPPWGATGAPGDQTCSQSGCHTGTPNTAGGNVKILLPSGNTGTYTPGQTMQLLVQITDSSKKAFGFEMTARLASNLKTTNAGDFNPSDANTQVICADGSNKTGSACPALFPIEDIEHTFAGYEASTKSSGTFTYTMNWTPPASASSGNVTLYVAANCGIGDPPVVSPTNIYTASLTLTPAAATNPPTISASGILDAATYQPTLAPNTYAVIFGQNLSTTNPGRAWAASDFTTNGNGAQNMPTALDGTSVTFNGTKGYVYYVSPTQVGVIVPNITATGSGIPVAVTLNGQTSAVSNITLQSLAPLFFRWQPSTTDNLKYLMAVHAATGSYVGKVGLFPGTPASFTTPAKPGETIILYGTGFGPTSPPIAPGILTDFSKSYLLSPAPSATLGGVPAQALAALIPTLGEVYQVNLTIPTGTPNGDQALIVNVNGTQSSSGLITVQGP